MARLLDTLPQTGRVEWIGVRPPRTSPRGSTPPSTPSSLWTPTIRAPMQVLSEVVAHRDRGLEGDRSRGGKRQVTLMQAEHLPVLAALCGRTRVSPEGLRRNLLIAGINLLALHNRRFCVGETLLEGTGLCQPCASMEQALGAGGFNAMRGHGGITARVLRGGRIHLGDAVCLFLEDLGTTSGTTPRMTPGDDRGDRS